MSVGDVKCAVTSATISQLQCNLPETGAGVYDVSVLVKGKGGASVNSAVKYRVEPSLSSISPTAGTVTYIIVEIIYWE